MVLIQSENYNDYPLSLSINVVDSFPCDYFMNNTFYTSKNLSKVDLLESMKAVNLCPDVDLNITFKSKYFEVAEDERVNYVNFLCNYDYNSTTGFVDSGSFYIQLVNTSESDIIYESNNFDIHEGFAIFFGTIFVICGLAFLTWLVLFAKKSKSKK